MLQLDMPYYRYINPKTKEIKDILQTMNEVHEYIDESGIKWDRVFTAPELNTNDKLTGENHLDDVIKITKLGTALDKKVRSYSQGMRQRLAIAQAMLGMPDLLVLDEPTNGLDPQQIAEMRQVLKDYAKTGRTVIVSSHLLAEVQQTCSHVVLMHRGKLIAFGPMKKILTKNRQSRSLEEIFLELIGDDLVIGKATS